MTDRDFKRFDPIVPESDDRIGRSSGGTVDDGRRRAAKRPPPSDSRGGGSIGGVWKFLVLVLVLGLAGMGYLLVQEKARLAQLQSRFDELEAKIVSTDESLNQSGATLGMKIREHSETLDKHWSEIRKLWGVSYDTNRKNIESQGATLAAQDKTIKGLQSSAAARKQEIAALAAKVDKAGQSVETAASSAMAAKLEVNDLASQLQEITARLNAVDKTAKDSSARTAANEEAIRAIDAYRLQVNRDLQLIKQQLGAPAG
ncbi:hypothetical protein [uncultured Porticoccus sp.]|uniref:hypothetical protein n=1 Tax=uncultured Porticoccus sp. TaxID=1256050 RepID=UPI00260A0F59|nr:hypothetical protein [uncultured Porticoccus sp.]